MRLTRRGAAVALLALASFVPGSTPRDAAAAPPASTEPVKCTCRDGNACYHWLNAPVTPPYDPCSCPNCRRAKNTCPKIYPESWNPDCIRSNRLECFLRRHAASWKLTCSLEMDKCECPGADSAACPECTVGGKPPDPKKFDKIRKQVAIEHKLLGEVPYVVVTSPHFYLVSDIPSLKVLTQNGSKREVGMHELAHLYIQRAEIAYDDFVRAFGDEIRGSRTIGIFLNKKKKDSERMQTEYFGRGNAGLVYGARLAGVPPISGGFCEAGLAVDLEQQTDDDALFQRMRTLEGSVLMSLWHSVDATTKHLPMWVFIGAGHWLGRLPTNFAEHAAFIGGEGNEIHDLGNEWMKRLAKAIAKPDFPHVDSFFGFTTLSQTDLVTHMRAWAWYSLFVDEDHDRFVHLLKLIRDGKNQRDAVQEVFACSAEELDQRVRDRVTGKRKALVDAKAPPVGATPPAAPSGFADLAAEKDNKTIYDRIKARTIIDDPADAAALVPLLERDSDLVHERIVLALSHAKNEAVREYLRGDALAKSHGKVKAGVVRILGLAKDDESAESVKALLADPDVEVRAQAALALGRMRHEAAVPALRPLLAEKTDETIIAAMDALAMFGESVEDECVRVTPHLDDMRRHVRTAAAECLGSLGSMESVDALIARMDKEEGRVRADIREALKKITRDDLGESPARWKEWWKKEKDHYPGKTPPRPPETPKPDVNERYAQVPTFYGIQLFSKRLEFLLDVSSSMSDHIVVDPDWLRKNGRAYKSDATKFDLASFEISATLRLVDPRLEFGIVTFRSDVKPWKEHLVPASPGTVDQALAHLESQRPPPMNAAGDISKQKTDLADALRIALGIKPGTTGRATDEAADEAYIMTDGAPTAGDLVDADVLLSWFREKNRLARLRLHVVTFETIDTDLKFLQSLATAGGGSFVAIPEKKR
jgi:HEAT repeat protein